MICVPSILLEAFGGLDLGLPFEALLPLLADHHE